MRRTALLLALVAVAGCRTGRNYTTPDGPRYAGAPGHTSTGERPATDTVRLVSFNIEFALHVDSAMAVLASDPARRGADVLLLQEMNEEATERIATALGLRYVYYPAFFHYRTNRHMGNAVLSRWPIVEDRKIVLPHVSRFVRTQRIATAATIRVGDVLTRLISAPWGIWHPGHAVISCAPSSRTPSATPGWSSAATGRLDHIFLKGLSTPDSAGAGTVLDAGGASDHLAVWAVGILR